MVFMAISGAVMEDSAPVPISPWNCSSVHRTQRVDKGMFIILGLCLKNNEFYPVA